jgi:hypothetical protein
MERAHDIGKDLVTKGIKKSMEMTPKRIKLKGLRAWIVPAMLAVLASTWALPAKADVITFDPTGGGGTGAVATSGFDYASSSVLAFGLSAPVVGATYPVYYESRISGGPNLSVGADGNVNGSGNQFTVIAGFSETITAITPVAGGALISFSPAAGGPNFFQMYANAPGSANPTTGDGSGFASGTLVLSGSISSSNFNGSFLTTGGTAPLNTSGQPTVIPSSTSTIIGGGGTSLTVNVTSQNANYFLTPLQALTFSTTNSLPFTASAPLTGFYSTTGLGSPDLVFGTNWNVGTVNGVNGQSLMFQSVANNGFVAVPEPGSIVPALTSAMALPSFLVFRRWLRGKKRGA